MANFFDQFDAPQQAGNFFDQFDAASPPPAPTPQVSNTGAKGDRELGMMETAGDVAQSIGTGLRAGVEALVGLPGDAQDLVEGAYEGVRSLIIDETPEEKAQRLAVADSVSAPGLPSTEDIRGVTNQVIGEARTPQTTAGEFAKTISEFAPAIVAGPGSAAKKAVMTVATGGTSEAAGQLTEGTAAEPFARVAGAVVGGFASAGSLNRAAKKALKEAPAEEDLKRITDSLYGELRQAGIQYNVSAYDKAVSKLAVDLRKKGFRAGTAPKAFSIVDELIENAGKQLDFDDLDSIRRAVGKVRTSPDETERAVAKIVVDAIDEFSLSAPITSANGRQPREVRELVLRARDFASRNIKQRQLNEAIEIASTRRSGFEAGLRNEFDKLLKGKKGRGWTAEERQAIKEVANGTTGRNAVRFFSKFGVDFSRLGSNAALLPGGAFGAGAVAGEPVIGSALVGAGTMARPIARAQTKAAAERTKTLVRAGRDTQQRVARSTKSDRLKANLRRALALDPAAQQATAPVE